MRGDAELIETLNEILTAELTAVNQYFAHSKINANWGYLALAAHYREESIDEMKDAERIIDRILFLEGLPNLQRLGNIRIGETVPEQLDVDRALEEAAVTRYQRAIDLAGSKGDHGTREMLEDLLVGEEHHLDWIETQQRIIAEIGLANYLSEKLS